MRVIFDSDTFDRQKFGGISRYFSELIRALRELKLAKVTTPFFLTENRHLRERRPFPVLPVPETIRWKYKSYYKRRINRLTTSWALDRKLGDIFHMTFYDLSLLSAIHCPLVVNAHDMIPELFPDSFLDPKSIHPNKRVLSERADVVLCVSHNTRSDLIRLFGIDPRKTVVTHLGIRPQWATHAHPVHGLPNSFLLLVGARSGYKNFRQVVDALGRLSRRNPELHLVCVGGGQLTEAEMQMIRGQSLLGRVHQLNLPDRELAYCYSKAAAFVFPSLYEGFGIPILEAFVAGCPAILSDRSCFPEIADDSAQYFDPDVNESLDEAILQLLHDRSLRDKLVERGKKRAAKFTWEKTAIATAQVYRRLL